MGAGELSTDVAVLDVGQVEYRLDRRGDRTVVVLHGGHMRASFALGEDDFVASDLTVLVPSRPGYGATPIATGRSPEGFADCVRDLCEHLGITKVAAVVGISAGGPTAIALAARHPALVERLILESAVGALPWPGRTQSIGAKVMFNAATERVTWAAVRGLLRVAPAVGLRAMLSGVSTRSGRSVVASLDGADRTTLLDLFARMRSQRGFANDVDHLRRSSGWLGSVVQPTLVVASRGDGAVPFPHAEALVAGLPNARLVVSDAASHFVWFGPDRRALSGEVRRFLASA